MSLTNEHLSVNVSLPLIQELEILHVDDLPIISAEDINKGYIDIKDAVTINIKSNVRLKLNVLTDKKSLYTSKEVDISNIKIKYPKIQIIEADITTDNDYFKHDGKKLFKILKKLI